MIRGFFFRALNRADREFPRFERAIETTATLVAIGLYGFATGLALVRWLRKNPSQHRCGADCATDGVPCAGGWS